MVRWVWPLFFLLSGCWGGHSLSESVDAFSFNLTGGTVFSDPSQVTTKELHFDTGHLLGKEVILEGKIVFTGKYFTHLVMNDDSGRMLVVLTHLDNAESLLKKKGTETIKVLGTVERGKKGLPYVLARSITAVDTGKKS